MGSHPVLLFDGVCNLCNGAVRFVLERDPAGKIRFASLQSAAARELLQAHAGARPNGPPRGNTLEHSSEGADDRGPALSSLLLVEGGRIYSRSTAALRLAGHMRAPWPMLRVGLLVPERWRDAMYDAVARNRYRWFGRSDACRLPTPQEASRFLG